MVMSNMVKTPLRRLNRELEMRNKVFLIVALLAFGCGKGQPVAKYQPGDVNVEAGHSAEWNFDRDPATALPAGTEVFSGSWQVRAQDDAPSQPNVLCQSGTAEFPAVCLSEKVYGDLVASVQFKPVSGRDDQAAGIIFRVQDRDNYYILRANALENNVNFYIYASGKRSSLKGSSAKVASGAWQELKVEVADSQFRGLLNG